MLPRILPVLIAAVLLFSGCVDEGGRPQEEQNAHRAGPIGNSTAPDWFRFEDCFKATLIAPVRSEWTWDFMPEGFRARVLVPGVVDVWIKVLDCERMVHRSDVRDNVTLVDARIMVYRQTEDGEEATQLVVDSFTNEPLLVEGGSAVGVAMNLAVVQWQESQRLDGEPSRKWSVEADECTFSFDLLNNTEHLSPKVVESYDIWYGSDPPINLSIRGTYHSAEFSHNDHSILEMSGTCALNRLFGQNPAWPMETSQRFGGHYDYFLYDSAQDVKP